MTNFSQTSIFDGLSPSIYLLTTAFRGKLSGMIATWVMSASLLAEHRRLVLVLSPHSFTTQILLKSGLFMIHTLDIRQLGLVPVFGLRSSATTDKFVNTDYHLSEDGLPVIENTHGWAKVQLASSIDDGDRIIVIGHVTSEQCNVGTKPLTIDQLGNLPEDIQTLLNNQFSHDCERDRAMV